MRYLAVFTQLAVLTLALSLASTVPAQTEQTAEVQARINSVISEAGVFFRDGLQDLSQGRRNSTGDKFDKAVNTFLLSGLNIQSDKKLSACYAQMIETIYRLEYPGEMQPQIKSLSETCGWNWSQTDFAIADKVIKDTREFVAASNKSKEQPTQKQTIAAPSEDLRGFNWQQYEPSPLDDLAKLQLTPEEQDLNNPVAQQQYRYIEYAVANKSLGFSFQVHPLIQQFINYYRGRGRATMEVGLYRSGLFMPMARRIFREEGVPENVAWLGQVESAWKPTAVSWAAASGLWQFIPGTASRFGLKRTAHVDERNSFDEATRASARYLKFLYNRYGNWELAIAAYNCGEGNVDRAISRAGVANFWAAYPYLPQETRNYVPNILATILIANNPAQYGFGHIRPAPPLRYDRIRVPSSTNLALLAQAADTTVAYLRYLNPHLRSNITPPEPYIINVPAGKANEVVAVFKRLPAAQRNSTIIAKSVQGETWETIAARTGVSVDELKAANPGMATPRGKVFVPQTAGNRILATNYSRPSNTQAVQNEARFKIVKAEAGDNIEKLARRHKVDPIEVAKLNGLYPNSPLGAGREIKIPIK